MKQNAKIYPKPLMNRKSTTFGWRGESFCSQLRVILICFDMSSEFIVQFVFALCNSIQNNVLFIDFVQGHIFIPAYFMSCLITYPNMFTGGGGISFLSNNIRHLLLSWISIISETLSLWAWYHIMSTNFWTGGAGSFVILVVFIFMLLRTPRSTLGCNELNIYHNKPWVESFCSA